MVNSEGSIDPNYNIPSNQSPVVDRTEITTGFGFDAQNERGVIPAAKIKNFSFNQGQGGTLTLGGVNDGNGVLFIKNDAGGTVVRADGTGIIINSLSGTTVIDSTGLNCFNNFNSDFFEINNSGTAIGTAPTSLGTINPFVLSRNTKILTYLGGVGATFNFGFDTNPLEWSLDLVDINTSEILLTTYFSPNLFYTFDTGTGLVTNVGQMYTQSSRTFINYLSAGTHTLKIQASVTGAGTVVFGNLNAGYVLLGN